ncbi:scoloptoxin SSD14 [Rhipicephalus sanguineus]|uniref:scoloptoxin SSD14 n=1 Tax=Rhipicephalus sanguineus TaxID=34632 RepID=UPI0018946412|nr:scoloptoxin SSD14 [Rhipicephalus sanguineus]
MAITAGWQCLFIFIGLVLVIASMMSASFFSFEYTKPLVDYPSTTWEYKDWAIVGDSDHCVAVAKNILLKQKGAIGDAAVAALACMAVLLPHRCGLGGGMMALYYDESQRTVSALEALGAEPYRSNASWFGANATLASYGRLATITPGALAGLFALHKRLGRLKWSTVLKPAIDIVQRNILVGPRVAEAIRRNEQRIGSLYSRMFLKDNTGLYIRANRRLYKLLIDVATEGWKCFYTGKHAKRLEDDITRDLGWLAVDDLERYEPHWIEPIALSMHTGKTLYAVPIPGGGALLGPILDLVNVTDGKLRLRAAKSVPHTHIPKLHRLVELLKFTYAQKASLGDTLVIRTRAQHNYTVQVLRSFYGAYDPRAALKTYAEYNATASIDYDDGGGAHLALRDKRGNALSIVMSLNWEFGCLYMSSCGFLMNNFMDSFSIPGGRNGLPMSENNANGMVKRPVTTMTPVIITDAKDGALFAALGATGGLQGISAMGQFLECIGTFAVLDCAHNSVRVHPYPDKNTFSLTVGPKLGGFDPEKELKNFGHNIVNKPLTATLNGIVLTDRNTWIAAGDVNYTDGGTRGEQYVHPILKNVAH